MDVENVSAGRAEFCVVRHHWFYHNHVDFRGAG